MKNNSSILTLGFLVLMATFLMTISLHLTFVDFNVEPSVCGKYNMGNDSIYIITKHQITIQCEAIK